MLPLHPTTKFSWKWVLPTLVFAVFTLVDLYASFIFDHVNLTLFWIPLYCWTLYRPDLVHPAGLFVAGLVYDGFLFLPLGLHSFLYVCFYSFLVVQRQVLVKQPFAIIWGVFAASMAVLNFALYQVIGDDALIRHVLGETFVQAIFYPLVVKILFHIKGRLMEPLP